MSGPELVSSRSEHEIAQAEAVREVAWASRALAVNVLRVVRGAGKPYELMSNIGDYVRAAQAYFDAHGFWPTQELTALLSYQENAGNWSGHDEHSRRRAWAIEEIIGGALQIAASRLAGQRTQEAAGETQLLRGVEQFQEAREQARAKLHKKRPVGFSELTRSKPKSK